MALDTKYRPLTYSDILGQEATIEVCRQFVREGKGFHQSYVFAGSHGSGKCVVGSTLVPTHKGLLPIQDLMGGPAEVEPIEIIVSQECGVKAQAAHSYRGGVRDTVRIRTHLGLVLEGTPNHRIRVMGEDGVVGWKPLGEIGVGDHVCVDTKPSGLFGPGPDLSGFRYERPPKDFRSIPFEPPSQVTPEWGRLMGYLIGDGDCCSRHVVIHSAEKDVQADILGLLERLCGSASLTPDKRCKNLAVLRCLRVQPREFLRYLGVGHNSAGDKEIPWSVLQSPKCVVQDFLRGYFESDGHVSPKGVEITTKSPRLSEQVQILLLQLGVLSRRTFKKHPKYGGYWRICVKGETYHTFEAEVGFVSARKQTALRSLVAQNHAEKSRLSNRWRSIPHQQERLRSLYANVPRDRRTRETCKLFRAMGKGGGNLSVSKMICILDQFSDIPGSEYFQFLRDTGYYYDPVEDISHGSAEVYDLNVPDGEMFSANGLMNHNTTTARVLARALLCENPQDGDPCDQCSSCRSIIERGSSENFTEMDAATKSGKDNITQITEDLDYATFTGKRRIYLFDEAHQLSKQALDALLKPMEDTVVGSEDKRLVCIFCTTEPEKMRSTIFSRCAPVFTIRSVSPEVIADRLMSVCQAEGLVADREALVTIAESTECHIRDALKTVEGVSMLGSVTRQTVNQYLRLDTHETILKILAYIGRDLGKALACLDPLHEAMSTTTMYEKLTEASMLAYRAHVGVGKTPAYWKPDWVFKLGAHHKEYLLQFADTFSRRPKKPTTAMLALDLSMCHQVRIGQILTHNTPSSQVPTNTTFAAPPVTSGGVSGKITPSGSTSDLAPEGSAPTQSYETSTGVYIDPRAIKRKKRHVVNPDHVQPLDPERFGEALAGRLGELKADGSYRRQEGSSELGRPGTDQGG